MVLGANAVEFGWSEYGGQLKGRRVITLALALMEVDEGYILSLCYAVVLFVSIYGQMYRRNRKEGRPDAERLSRGYRSGGSEHCAGPVM